MGSGGVPTLPASSAAAATAAELLLGDAANALEVARFLKETPGLGRVQIGTVLGDGGAVLVLQSYVSFFDFSDVPSNVEGVESALKLLEGRWKLVILFHLFGGQVLRFSDLERSIEGISQKMLIQQLRQMEADGIVRRIVHHQVPPKVEYCLTDWGQALCPALDALLSWAAQREAATPAPAMPEPAAP